MMSFYFVGLAFGSVHSNDPIVAPEVNTCTVDQFKQVANDSYRPWCEYRDWETDRKSTRLNSSHSAKSRMPSSA